jgi:hypothetical protein
VVCQLIFFVLLGAMGDYGSMRKRMLIVRSGGWGGGCVCAAL